MNRVVRMSVLSTDMVWATGITADLPDGPVDPRGFPVYMAYALVGEEPSLWEPAEWDGASPVTGPFRAGVLTGPDGVLTPAAGRWRIWVRIVAGGTGPIIVCGTLVVTDP